ncbi:MAG TPA: hypothetical protein VHP59_09030, partial [Vineibacter terrae]
MTGIFAGRSALGPQVDHTPGLADRALDAAGGRDPHAGGDAAHALDPLGERGAEHGVLRLADVAARLHDDHQRVQRTVACQLQHVMRR